MARPADREIVERDRSGPRPLRRVLPEEDLDLAPALADALVLPDHVRVAPAPLEEEVAELEREGVTAREPLPGQDE